MCMKHTRRQFAKGGKPLQGPLESDRRPRRARMEHREDSEEQEFQARLSRMEENMENLQNLVNQLLTVMLEREKSAGPESSNAGTSKGHQDEDKEELVKTHPFGTGKASHNFPPFKVEAKVEIPPYEGQLDAEKLNNWLSQLEVYFGCQGLDEE
eukprot:Gb_13779 [translate_table: standard]